MMKRSARRSLRIGAPLASLALLITAAVVPVLATPAAAAAGCSTSVRSGYQVELCFTQPLSGATLTGEAPVTITVTITGNDPGVRRVDVTMDGEALLTDVSSPYEFVIPSAKYVDGSKILTAQALLRDNNTTVPASIPVTFSNGNAQPPINTNTFTPHAPSGTHGRLFATGDGAGGRPESLEVVSSIAAMNPDLFFYLGDVYERGTVTEMYNWYGHDGSYFNAFYDITNPVIGNHEYDNGSAPGYFDYWDNVDDYYSYDAFGWHFIALNSDSHLGQYTPGTPQYDWLVADLAASSSACTVAYWHHPRFSVGPQGNTPEMQPIWQLLADNGVDLVLAGHDHSYQRFEPLDGAGNPDPDGMLSIVAGAGGHGVQSFAGTDPRLVVGIDQAGQEGSLRVDLNPAGAELAYVHKSGQVMDATTLDCSGAGPDVTPPTEPTGLSAVAASGTQVDLSWNAAQDDTAVAGYTIYRDDVPVDTVTTTELAYSDLFLTENTTYDYQIDAFDLAGNHSPRTPIEQVTTPGAPTAYHFDAIADAYVNESSPSNNYGTAPLLRIDGSPIQQSYLEFDVLGIVGTIEATTLRIWANSSSSVGFEVRAVPVGSWTEGDLNYSNAPSPGALVGSSGPLTAGQYNDIDLGGFVTGDGAYSLVLTPLSSSGISLASRESGTPPQLEVAVTPVGNAPPTADDLSLAAVQEVLETWIPVVDDANGDTLTCSIGTAPANGLATVAADCSSGTYTSDPGYEGPDSFTYVVDDGQATDEGTVSVTVTVPVAYGPNPVADAYVDGSNPSTNYGSSTQLRTDASPLIQSYLLFGVNEPQGTIVSATLRIHADSSLSAGFELHEVADTGWDEGTVDANTAPTVGNLIAASGPVSSGAWIELDVTASITAGGLYSFALTPLSNTNLRLSSRETVTPPELIITEDLSGNSPPTADPVAFATPEDTPAAWAPSVTDPDPGDVLTCTIVSPATIGSATVSSDCASGSYTPDPDGNGADSFTYEVSDGSLTATATVDVSVTAVNDAPTADAADTSTFQDTPVVVALSGGDVDGDCPLTFAIDTGPAGTLGPITNVQCSGGSVSAEVEYTPAPGATGPDSFTYTVSDPAAATSAPATVTIDVAPPQTSLTVQPLADAYVDGSNPSTNYGSSTQLRTDASPLIQSYLLFDATGIPGSVSSATLRIHVDSNLSAGFEVRSVADTGWDETTISFANAPTVGAVIATSGPVSAGTWVEIDVTAAVTGPGLYSLALTPLSNTNLRLSSRETATPPELVIQF